MSCTMAKRGYGFFEESPERFGHLTHPLADASPLAAKRCRIMAPPAPMYHARAETSPAAAAAAPPAASSAEARLRAMKHAHHDVSDDDASDSDDDGTDPRQEALQQYLSQAAPAPLGMFLNRRQRKKMAMAQEMSVDADADSDSASAAHHAAQGQQEHLDQARGAAHRGERLFTAREVEQIVGEAVQRREEELTKLFQTTLQEQLAEQFNQFSKFNEDFLHRRMEQSTFSYMS